MLCILELLSAHNLATDMLSSRNQSGSSDVWVIINNVMYGPDTELCTFMDLLLSEDKQPWVCASRSVQLFHQQPIKNVASDRKRSENIFSNKSLYHGTLFFQYTVSHLNTTIPFWMKNLTAEITWHNCLSLRCRKWINTQINMLCLPPLYSCHPLYNRSVNQMKVIQSQFRN